MGEGDYSEGRVTCVACFSQCEIKCTVINLYSLTTHHPNCV